MSGGIGDMLKRQFQEEAVTVLVAVAGAAGPLGGKGPAIYSAASTYQGLVTALGQEEVLKLGLVGVAERFRVRLPAGLDLSLSHRLMFRGQQWRIVALEHRTSYTKAIAEEVR